MLNNNSLLDDLTPMIFQLSQNYPNPFKDRTTIKYCIAYKTKVKLKVYDEEHKEIETLVDEEKNPGTYEVVIHPSVFSQQSSGDKYFYRLEAGDYKCEKKMELIK